MNHVVLFREPKKTFRMANEEIALWIEAPMKFID
jgi:hypothetical protein